MTKIEIINKLEICISIMQGTENTFVSRQLEEISKELIKQWNDSEWYFEQIRQELSYEQRNSKEQ